MNNINNKIIILTGASKGIGRVTALKLKDFGPKLVLVSRNIEDLKKVSDELQYDENKILIIKADVSIESDCKRIVDEAVKKFGTIDILINNAAQFSRSKVLDLTTADFDNVMNTNIRGVFILTKLALPYMIKQNEGSILNVSSTSGKRGYAGGAAYAASKFALNGFMECLFREVREFNIRVLTISPSMVDTRVKSDSAIKSGGKGVYMRVEDVAEGIIYALSLPQRALIKDIEIWGTNP